MKKLILLVAILAMTTATSFAQIKETKADIPFEKNTIGLKLGYGADVSYQRFLNEKSRVEVDLGIGFGDSEGFNMSATYQWLFGLDVEGVGFNWYAGAGLGTVIHSNYFGLAVVGQIGIEYKFKAPITLSLDWKPAINVVPEFDFGWQGFALGVRYRF